MKLQSCGALPRISALGKPQTDSPKQKSYPGGWGKAWRGAGAGKGLLLRGGQGPPAVPPSTCPPRLKPVSCPAWPAARGTDGSATAEGAQGRRDESETASPPLGASAARAGVSRWGTFGVHVASGSRVCFSGISFGERKTKAIRFQAAALLCWEGTASSASLPRPFGRVLQHSPLN